MTHLQSEIGRDTIILASFDNVSYADKPVGLVGAITNRLTTQSGMLGEFVTRIADGYSWSGAIFLHGKGRTKETWVQQQVFGIDVDSGQTVAEFLAIAEQHGIFPVTIYETFSSNRDGNGVRFRPVFVTAEPVTDFRVRTAIQAALITLFEKVDDSCQDGARLFFGGTNVLYENYGAVLDAQRLLQAVYVTTYERDKVNAARAIENFCSWAQLDMLNGAPHVEEVRPTVLIYNNTHGLSSSHTTEWGGAVFTFTLTEQEAKGAKEKGKAKPNKRKEARDYKESVVRDVSFRDLLDDCPVLRDFEAGIDSHNDVTWAILTNLVHIWGGEDFFWTCLHKRTEYNDTKWRANLNYIKKVGTNPTRYDSDKLRFAYPDAAALTGANSIHQLASIGKRGVVEVITEIVTQPVDVVYRELYGHVDNWLTDTTRAHVTFIRGDVGTGKTTLMAALVDSDVIIAVPFHALKKEISDKLTALGKAHLVTPELPESLTASDRAIIDRFYAIGAANKAVLHLRALAKNDTTIAQYIEQLQSLASYRGILICTHARLPYLNSPIKRVIVDECILGTLLQTGNTQVSDVRDIRDASMKRSGFGIAAPRHQTPVSKFLSGIMQLVDSAIPGHLTRIPLVAFTDSAKLETVVCASPVKSNVLGFVRCAAFIKDEKGGIQFITRNSLPKGKDYVVLSATGSSAMYTLAFSGVRYIDTSPVSIMGEIKQYTRYSGSRNTTAQDKTGVRVAYVNARIPKDAPVITYKQYRDLFDNTSDLYFGNLRGIDKYAGSNLVVYGTPHMNPETYILIASVLDAELETHELSKDIIAMRSIERNGMRFNFPCYPEGSILHEIQLTLIESELVQAVGRARVARFPVTVYLFSDCPMRGATFLRD